MTRNPGRAQPVDSEPGELKTQVQRVAPQELDRFLERRRRSELFPSDTNLGQNLVELLHKANEFVPSESGSILLDDPLKKLDDRRKNTLTFIAAFGEKAEQLVGRAMPTTKGIAGHVYLTGKPHHTSKASSDPRFYSKFDKLTHHRTESLVAIPIRIEHDVCGVLELINRRPDYSEQDCKLLGIFAGYMSIAIQNVLDAKHAQEIAKRDNLTDLYNDRYLHVALATTVEASQSNHSDLAVLFIDLDYFKRVNDSHGHLAGSQVLREVGHLLRRIPPDGKAIPARYGGDEFVLVLPNTDLKKAVEVAEEIRVEILATTFCEKPGIIQPDPLHLRGLTCSIGVASLRRHVTEEQPVRRMTMTLLALADAAMYVAKETGRNRTAVAGEPVMRRDTTNEARTSDADADADADAERYGLSRNPSRQG